MGEGSGGGDAAQLFADRRLDAIEIGQDLVVPKPQNAITFVLQELGALGFPRERGVMLTAVDFHDHQGFVGYKICDVAANWYLTAELVPLYLMQTQ